MLAKVEARTPRRLKPAIINQVKKLTKSYNNPDLEPRQGTYGSSSLDVWRTATSTSTSAILAKAVETRSNETTMAASRYLPKVPTVDALPPIVLLAFQIVFSGELLLASGAGDRPACERIAIGRSTALQRVGGACRRTFVLVAQLLFSQAPKFVFSTFGPTRLLPKLIRSRVDFLFAGFSHCVFSELEHGPTFQACWGLFGGTVLDQRGDWPFGFKST